MISFRAAAATTISDLGGGAFHFKNGNWKCQRFLTIPPNPNQNPISLNCSAAAGNKEGFMVSSEEEGVSFYQLLGIPESGSLNEIKQAYKQLVLKYHPDVYRCDDESKEYCTSMFIQVQEAYETLSDPTRRACYDRNLGRGLHFAFSARRKQAYYDDQDGLMENRNEWKNRWEAQVAGLKKKSMSKASGDNLSWAAQMRRKRGKSFDK